MIAAAASSASAPPSAMPEQLRVAAVRDVHRGEAEAEHGGQQAAAPRRASPPARLDGTVRSDGSTSDSGVGAGGRRRRVPCGGLAPHRAQRRPPRRAAWPSASDRAGGSSGFIAPPSCRSLADQPGHDHHRQQRQEPRHHALGDRAEVVDPPSPGIAGAGGSTARSERSNRAGAGRSAWRRSAASRRAPFAPPRPPASAVACCRSGTTAPSVSPPRATIWWQPAQCNVKSCRPSARSPFAGSAVGRGGPPNVPT